MRRVVGNQLGGLFCGMVRLKSWLKAVEVVDSEWPMRRLAKAPEAVAPRSNWPSWPR